MVIWDGFTTICKGRSKRSSIGEKEEVEMWVFVGDGPFVLFCGAGQQAQHYE